MSLVYYLVICVHQFLVLWGARFDPHVWVYVVKETSVNNDYIVLVSYMLGL